jgi:hypothetical protein
MKAAALKRRGVLVGSVLGACFLLAGLMTAVVFPGGSGPVRLPAAAATIAAQNTSSTCNSLELALGLCGSTTTTTTTGGGGVTTTTACNALLMLLNDCPPASTTTTTTTPPTTTTTTTIPSTTTTTSVGSGCSTMTPPVAPPTGESAWTCSFDDEFNGTALDTTKWVPLTTATTDYTNGSAPGIVCYVNNPQTISESGGTLNLSVVQVPAMSCPTIGGLANFSTQFEGGDVNSSGLFSQEYGFFEAYAEMPASKAEGLQETLWLYPLNQSLHDVNGSNAGSRNGEIDYGEFYSEYPQYDVPAVHYPGASSTQGATSDTNACADLNGAMTAGQFNYYGLSWTPTTITAYFNGVPCITDTYAARDTQETPPAPFDQPFFLNFTAALGLNNGTGDQYTAGVTQLPATTHVDWMRVWK